MFERKTTLIWTCDMCSAILEIEEGNPPIGTGIDEWKSITIGGPSAFFIRHDQCVNQDSPPDISHVSHLCPACLKLAQARLQTQPSFRDYLLTYSRMLRTAPVLTVDAVLFDDDALPVQDRKVLLVKRKYPPHGWAFPGGHVDVGETLENAVMRELLEETNLTAQTADVNLLLTASKPDRDPRFHAVSLIYRIVAFTGEPQAGDDAAELGWFSWAEIEKMEIAFDHRSILDFIREGLKIG